MQFDMESKHIHFTSYNTYVNQYAGNSVDQSGLSTFGQPRGFSDFSLAMSVQVINAETSHNKQVFPRTG